MKILKYGDGYPKTVTCYKCKSELEYTLTDIKHTQEIEYSSDPLVDDHIVRVEYVVCPVCGDMVRTFTSPIWSCHEDTKKRWWKS
jgi:hypothetical protein